MRDASWEVSNGLLKSQYCLQLQYDMLLSLIACESAKTEGIIFKSPGESNDYLDAGSWGKPLDALTSCIWVKFKDSSRDMDCVFNNRALDLAMVRYKKDLTFFGGNFKLR